MRSPADEEENGAIRALRLYFVVEWERSKSGHFLRLLPALNGYGTQTWHLDNESMRAVLASVRAVVA